MLQRIGMRKTQNVYRNEFIDLLLDSVQENVIEEMERFIVCNSFVLYRPILEKVNIGRTLT